MLNVIEAYANENCGCCREWFSAQAHVRKGNGAPHRGIGKTKQNVNKRLCIVGRTVVSWIGEKYVNGKKMERKPRLGKN